MSLAGQKVLLTGGAGYAGSMLVPQLLHAGYGVRVLDSLVHGGHGLLGVWANPAFEFIRGDVRDRPRVREAVDGCDAVVHLAAIVGDPACARQAELAESVNLDASLQLLDTASSSGVSRFVFASTCSNYGKMSDPNDYVDESSELRPVSLYARTKVAVEKAILDGNRYHELCTTSLRFATVYGASPRMRFDLTVNEFTMEMIVNKKLVVYGEQFSRPYVHVRDTGRAVLAVLEAPVDTVNNEVFNVGATDQNYRKQTLVEKIGKIVPDADIEYVEKAEDPRDYRVSFKKIGDILGFKISRTVDEGIAEIAQLVRDGLLVNCADAKYRN